jgi:hypothetical protein
MDLYVCYGTIGPADRHPFARSYRVLTADGLRPKVITTPSKLDPTSSQTPRTRRKAVEREQPSQP